MNGNDPAGSNASPPKADPMNSRRCLASTTPRTGSPPQRTVDDAATKGTPKCLSRTQRQARRDPYQVGRMSTLQQNTQRMNMHHHAKRWVPCLIRKTRQQPRLTVSNNDRFASSQVRAMVGGVQITGGRGLVGVEGCRDVLGTTFERPISAVE
jgi:hypothetical protein